MKILEFKGKISLKNKLLIALAIGITIFTVIIILLYIFNENVRDWMNIYVLGKSVTEDDIATINLEVDKSQYVYAYDRFISVLCSGKLSVYNSYASKESELDISISNPTYATNNNFLCIGETGGQKLYLISDNRILWENKIEGNINKINVSKTGNVSVIVTGTSYKSVIITFDRNGNELFKTFLWSTIAIDTDISVDGKYLAIAEVSTNGVLIESGIRIYDIEKAVKNDSTNSLVFKNNADSGKIITDIKYQERGQLVCIYNDSIHIIAEESDNQFVEFNSNTQIADINLKSCVVRAEETSTGPFSAKTDIILKNILTGVDTTYTVDSSVKELVSYNNITAVNLGTEVHFVNLNGWLEKKYTSNQEAKEIVLGTSVAGIVYRDRIKVLTF